ncbi:MAG: type II toxin-antitoxin system VapC family toxin [Oligoflexia bacterium]|nr:type II toxin-antitoxin system VapC family toxin [Oligoflexia bacterium]
MTVSCKVIDSSVWIEILSKGVLHNKCVTEIENAEKIIVPALVVFEVYKKICMATSDDIALSTVTMLSQYYIEDLTRDIALIAGDISIEHKLAAADSIVLAHARHNNATLITLDNDFSGIPSAKIIRS